MVTCFNSPDGMGVCLRDRMTDAGILPRTAAAEVPDATPEASAAIAQPAMDAAPETATPATAADDLIEATFGLLRAEPDGSIVIAGSGTPGTEVEIYANDTLLGKAIVEPSGDWVLVPDAPLPPGGAEITLGEAGSTGRAAQAFVVAINEDLSSEPLVVASAPGSISQVLQGLDPVEVDVPTQVAATAPTQTPGAVTAPATEPATLQPAHTATQAPAADQASAVNPVTPAPAPAEAPVSVASAPDAMAAAPSAQPSPVAPDAATPAETLAKAPSASTPAGELAQGATASEPSATAEPSAPAAPPVVPAIASATDLATAEPAALAEVTAALGANAPTIDAIEIDGDKTFFAGAGPDGGTLRLYVDEQFIADTAVADGRWLVEAGKVLTNPSQRIRVDLLQPGSAKVVSRAEVDFVIDQPVAVAIAEEPAASVALTASDAAEPIEAAPVVTEAEPAPAEIATVESPAASEAPATPASPAAATAQAGTPAADAVPTMVAVSVGDPNAERFGAGKAIIRRGDNLWTIARRVYGEGIKYTTIYQANTGQIRDPDRIYPGQVFELPSDQN